MSQHTRVILGKDQFCRCVYFVDPQKLWWHSQGRATQRWSGWNWRIRNQMETLKYLQCVTANFSSDVSGGTYNLFLMLDCEVTLTMKNKVSDSDEFDLDSNLNTLSIGIFRSRQWLWYTSQNNLHRLFSLLNSSYLKIYFTLNILVIYLSIFWRIIFTSQDNISAYESTCLYFSDFKEM